MIVLDTHALVWWLAEPSKISAKARKVIQEATADKALAVSAASILEIATLVRRQRLVFSMPFDEWLNDLRELPELELIAVSADIAARAGLLSGDVHGDPIDRLIIATAIEGKARLVTADENIRSSNAVRTVW